jgi:hypothetical protein
MTMIIMINYMMYDDVCSLKVREEKGTQCFIQSNVQLMYPVFNTLGTFNFDAFINSWSDVSFSCTDDGCSVTQNGPLNVSEAACTPCDRPRSNIDSYTCGKASHQYRPSFYDTISIIV